MPNRPLSISSPLLADKSVTKPDVGFGDPAPSNRAQANSEACRYYFLRAEIGQAQTPIAFGLQNDGKTLQSGVES